MKVLLYTYDLVPGTERLMPWRTLLEVARWMNGTQRYEAAVCSGGGPEGMRLYEGVRIYGIDPTVEALKDFIAQGAWDVVCYPVTFRQGLKNIGDLADVPAKMIAYIPGGLYPLPGVFRLMKDGHWKRALPYLLDSLTPHRLLARKLHRAGVCKLICQSPLTAEDAHRSGWKENEVFCALPGKESSVQADSTLPDKLGIAGQRYLLFCGAPAPTRGAVLALRAFDRVADRIPEVKLVMLMRRDAGSDFSEFEAAAGKLKHKDQVLVVYDRVSREQLFGMFASAWAVLLPFLVVPSEIPLTFFEVMGLGAPVITFENGGTTDYLRNALMIARKRNEKCLGDAMIRMCRDEAERNRLSAAAKEQLCNHPTWEETAAIWAKAIDSLNA